MCHVCVLKGAPWRGNNHGHHQSFVWTVVSPHPPQNMSHKAGGKKQPTNYCGKPNKKKQQHPLVVKNNLQVLLYCWVSLRHSNMATENPPSMIHR